MLITVPTSHDKKVLITCTLTRWAQKNIKEGEVNQIVASSLLEEILPESLKEFVKVAERCLHDETKNRPIYSGSN